MMPHQRYIVDVAGELNPDTGRRWYELVILEMPRQNAKTNTIEPVMLQAARRPEPDGSRPRRVVVYTSDLREKARERLIVDLWEGKLERHPKLGRAMKATKARGSERLTWRDTGGRIMLQASNATAGHSLTVDDAVLDEAYAHRDLTIVNGIQPTMLTKPDPQLWIVSTKGDGSDGLLLHYEEIAAIAVKDPDTRVAVFIWQADEDDDRYDPRTYRKVMPALGRTITEERVKFLAANTPADEFDRAYLNRRPTVATVAALDVEAWHACANRTDEPLMPTGAVVLAVDVDPDRTHATIAVAWSLRPGVVAGIVHRAPGTGWVVDRALKIAHTHGLTVVDVWGDRRAGIGGILDQMTGRGLPVHEVSAGDVASAAGDLYDLTRDGGLVHDNQPKLNDAVTGSRRRPLGEAWTFSKVHSVGDVAPVNALALAVAGYRHHFPTGRPAGGIR